LAGLSPRAQRDGDTWVVNGQKIWTSLGHVATWGILIARTNPDVPKQRGISYFICPMDAPGPQASSSVASSSQRCSAAASRSVTEASSAPRRARAA
jgi:alkylation response protein AidB-like acyl-CoA dehydrogenase